MTSSDATTPASPPIDFLPLLCCPACRGDVVRQDSSTLRCTSCGRTFPILENIPVLLPEAGKPAQAGAGPVPPSAPDQHAAAATLVDFLATDRLELVLDAWCRDGDLLAALPVDCARIGLHTDLESLRRIQRDGLADFLVCGDPEMPPFQHGQFDAVIARHPDPQGGVSPGYVARLAKSLRDGGDLLLELRNAWLPGAGPRPGSRSHWPRVRRWMRQAGCHRVRLRGSGAGPEAYRRFFAGMMDPVVVRASRGSADLEIGPVRRLAARCERAFKSSRLNNTAARAELADEARRAASSPTPSDTHLREALDWLARAHDATGRRGVSRGYAVGWMPYFDLKGWEPAYPETTGHIIPSLFDAGALPGFEECRARAIELTEWELELQLPTGAVMWGTVGHGPVASVFSTGQVMFGLERALRETRDGRYGEALDRAARFLVASQDSDGAFRVGRSPFSRRRSSADHARVGWALTVAGEVLGVADYRTAGLRCLRQCLVSQQSNGWFADLASPGAEAPFTENICFAVEGLLGGGEVTGDQQLLDAARLAAGRLAGCVGPTGRLPARLDADWRPTVTWDCLPGSAQLSALFLRFHLRWPDTRYRDPGVRLLRFLELTQNCDSADPGLRGGIKGAFPFDAGYGRFQTLNYATRYFVDALLLERALDRS